MILALPIVLALFSVPAIAGSLKSSGLRPKHLRHALHARNNTPSDSNRPPPSNFKLKDMYKGQDFLDRFDFFADEDPTHGSVNFQTKENAIKKKLAFVENGTAVLAVDDFSTVPVGGRRDSVRVQSQKTYNGGLFIADFLAMPHGCSVWPAYWSVGPNWPAGGEIDVLEGVHEGPTNQYTLHTAPGCEIKNDFSQKEVTSNLLNAKCQSSGADNRGCAFSDHDPRTYGHQFNILDGGVFAHLWDNTGIKIWRFSRNEIPADIDAQQPNPASWGTPAANFPSTNCNISEHFFEHQLVLDTTLCGDFAGPTFQGSGCPGTCEQAMANNENFKFAKWRINYIAVYDF